MEDRMNVILDLDNTIINALEEYERESLPLGFQSQFEFKDIVAYGMRIFARPGLQRFLDFLFANFNVSVFTAAEQEYALFIINNFLLTRPNRKVHYLFFRYHVDMAMKRYDGMKDLRLLWNVLHVPNMYPCNTVIIDDLVDVYDSNPNNTIRIKAFNVIKDGKGNPEALKDDDLLRMEKILTKLNQYYKQSPFVRLAYQGSPAYLQSPFDL